MSNKALFFILCFLSVSQVFSQFLRRRAPFLGDYALGRGPYVMNQAPYGRGMYVPIHMTES